MAINPQLNSIRAKTLGVLIRSARLSAQKSIEECAEYLKIDKHQFENYEYGEQAPSLPELEILAEYFDVQLKYFRGRELKFNEDGKDQQIDTSMIINIRQKIIGTLIRKQRIDLNLLLEELAERVSIAPQQLEQYELGEKAIPVPELEAIGGALEKPLEFFEDHEGLIGTRLLQKQMITAYLDLPVEMQNFINKPVNFPYIELAMRLSEMPVEKLRLVAEGLLEITL